MAGASFSVERLGGSAPGPLLRTCWRAGVPQMYGCVHLSEGYRRVPTRDHPPPAHQPSTNRQSVTSLPKSNELQYRILTVLPERCKK